MVTCILFYFFHKMKYYCFIELVICVHSIDYYETEIQFKKTFVVQESRDLYWNETYFPPLQNYQVNAIQISEERYPWIARVVHSKNYDYPYVCTAVCIEERIFITAARCAYEFLKVDYTTVIYKKFRFPVITSIVAENYTKQMFDDIGFLVVNDQDFQEEWANVELFDKTNRTDEYFDWFAELALSEQTVEHVVVGYATQKGIHRLKSPYREFNLYELDVIVSINICPKITVFNNLVRGFRVPCYHSCSVSQFHSKDFKCSNYHGVEGAAVLNIKTRKLLGIATWGALFTKYELPVGFSIPNSISFFDNYACSQRIKQVKNLTATEGYYQSLCEGKGIQ